MLTDDELVVVRDFLKKLKHACLYIRNERPHKFTVLGIYIKGRALWNAFTLIFKLLR